MFTTTIRINTADLNEDILTSIKTMFGKKDVEIVVSEATDETDHLFKSANNKKHLLKGVREARKAKGLLKFSAAEFRNFNKKKLKGK